MHGNRRGLRRAQSWRWEPPGADATLADATLADELARQRWSEARAKAIAWAAEVVGDSRVVYLDTETTGFGPRAEIVDIAVVSAAGEVLLESLVQPNQRIPPEVTAIHGITDADVKNAPEWCDLYEELLRVLAGRRIIVYNVIFDRQMVSQACERYSLTPPAADWECAMRRYAGFYGNWDQGKRWYRFQKLEHAVVAFGARPGGHRAAADAFACRTVVLGMAATPVPKTEPAHIEPTNARLGGRSDEENSGARFPATGEMPREVTSPPTPLDVYARWMRAARTFMALLDRMPADLRDRPGACGDWTVREVVAHCAGWEWEGARRLRLIATDPTLPDAFYNVDGFNAASVAVRARQDWTRTVDELIKASNTLARAASSMLEDTRTQQWLVGRAADFEEHVDGLQRWLVEMAYSASENHADLMK